MSGTGVPIVVYDHDKTTELEAGLTITRSVSSEIDDAGDKGP